MKRGQDIAQELSQIPPDRWVDKSSFILENLLPKTLGDETNALEVVAETLRKARCHHLSHHDIKFLLLHSLTGGPRETVESLRHHLLRDVVVALRMRYGTPKPGGNDISDGPKRRR